MRWHQSLASWLAGHHRHCGLAGSAVIVAGMAAAMIPYTGTQGEGFSILNHFISELGQRGVSEGAWAFNGGLIVGGILLIPFMAGLGLALPGLWSKLGLLAGLVAAVSAALVGVFPMNELRPHALVAMTYFRSGLLTTLLFGIAIWRQGAGKERVDRRANWAGLLAVASFAAFLVYMQIGRTGAGQLDPTHIRARPQVWLLPILEWATFFSTVLWFAVVALAQRGKVRGVRPDA